MVLRSVIVILHVVYSDLCHIHLEINDKRAVHTRYNHAILFNSNILPRAMTRIPLVTGHCETYPFTISPLLQLFRHPGHVGTYTAGSVLLEVLSSFAPDPSC